MNKIGIVIVAGGIGTRMGTSVPKQFLDLCGKPVLMRTLERFREVFPAVDLVVVLPENEIPRWSALCAEHRCHVQHTVVSGGATRFHSVQKGIRQLGPCDYIGVHDGVRPLVSRQVILSALDTARRYGSAVPVLGITDSIREIDSCPTCDDISSVPSRIVSRDRFVAVQTPQFFRAEPLLKSYRQEYDPGFTDDASVVEKAGHTVALAQGDAGNIKITTPTDLLIAEALYRSETAG